MFQIFIGIFTDNENGLYTEFHRYNYLNIMVFSHRVR